MLRSLIIVLFLLLCNFGVQAFSQIPDSAQLSLWLGQVRERHLSEVHVRFTDSTDKPYTVRIVQDEGATQMRWYGPGVADSTLLYFNDAGMETMRVTYSLSGRLAHGATYNSKGYKLRAWSRSGSDTRYHGKNFTYDSNGNLASASEYDPSGELWSVIQLTYDSKARLLTIADSSPLARQVTHFSYDQRGNVSMLARLRTLFRDTDEITRAIIEREDSLQYRLTRIYRVLGHDSLDLVSETIVDTSQRILHQRKIDPLTHRTQLDEEVQRDWQGRIVREREFENGKVTSEETYEYSSTGLLLQRDRTGHSPVHVTYDYVFLQ